MRDYRHSLGNNSEERSSQLLRSGSLRSRIKQKMQELNINPVLDKIQEHRTNWLQHINGNPHIRLLWILINYRSTVRRKQGRPFKKLLGVRDSNVSTCGMTPCSPHDDNYDDDDDHHHVLKYFWVPVCNTLHVYIPLQQKHSQKYPTCSSVQWTRCL